VAGVLAAGEVAAAEEEAEVMSRKEDDQYTFVPPDLWAIVAADDEQRLSERLGIFVSRYSLFSITQSTNLST